MAIEPKLFPRALGLLLSVGLCASCVSLRWRRDLVDRGPAPEHVAQLLPGSSGIDACLERLGAPSEVWELPGGGCALAWAWRHGRSLGVSLSVPFGEQANASADYDRADATREAYVGFFDADLVLRELRRGRLVDLRGPLNPALPPSVLEAGARPQAAP
jgi:hypothetical protein